MKKQISINGWLTGVLAAMFLFAMGNEVMGQTAFTSHIDNIGATTCPGSNINFGTDLFQNLPAGVTFSGFSRSVVGCASAGSHYRSTNYNSDSKADAISDNRYVNWILSTNASVELTLSEIAISHERSNTGGDNGAIYYSINGAAFTQVGGDFTVGTSSNRTVLSFGTPVNVPASGTIEFRFYGWKTTTTGGGNVRIIGGNNYAAGSGIVGTFTTLAVPVVNITSDFSTFVYALGGGPSSPQSYNISGSNLDNDIVLAVPANFEHSLNEAGPYQTTDIELSPTAGTVDATDVYVRMVEGLGAGSYGGDITVTSDDASSPQTIALTGEVLSETLPYLETFGTTAGVFPLGWTTSGPGAAIWQVNTASESPGSGGANLVDPGGAGTPVGEEAIITADRGISTVGADLVFVTFLARQTSAYSGAVLFDFSTDGDNWTNVEFANVANNATWAPVVIELPPAAAGVDNLRFRFRTTRTNTSGNYRIDDVLVFAPATYFYAGGDVHDVNSWFDSGMGNPPDFTSDNQIFAFAGEVNPATTAPWTVSGTNSAIVLGNGTDAATLTISSGSPITGLLGVTAHSTLILSDATLPTFAGNDPESTVIYNQGDAVNIFSTAYGNLTVTGAGTKTFPNSTIAVNGNLLFEDVTLAFAGSNARIDYSGDITLQGSVSYSGGLRPEYRITANDNAQTINTGTNTLEAWNFYAQNKTGGSLTLAAGNANISAGNNLRLNFPAGATFNDGGNTIVFGDDIRVQGDAASYTLTGTLRLQASSGTNDFENIDVPLNNVEIITTGTADPQFADGANTKDITINGDFYVSLENRDLIMNDVTLRIGGDFTFETSGDGVVDSGTSTVIFNGDGNQFFTVGMIIHRMDNGNHVLSSGDHVGLHNVTLDKPSGTLTLGGAMHVGNTLTLTQGTLASGGNLTLVSTGNATGGHIAHGGTGAITGDVNVQRTLAPADAPAGGSGMFTLLGTAFEAPFRGGSGEGLFSNVWTQGATGAETPEGSPNILTYNSEHVIDGAGDVGGWVGLTDFSGNMQRGQGFLAYIYTWDDYENETGSWPKTLTASGAFHASEVDGSNVVLSLTYPAGEPADNDNTGLNLLTNPFMAPISWGDGETGIALNNVKNQFWLLQEDGSFVAYDGATQTGAGLAADGNIAMNQAFFVQATNTGGSVSINSEAKTTSASILNQDAPARMRFMLADGQTSSETVLVWFDDSQKKGVQLFPPVNYGYSLIYTEQEGVPMNIRYVNPDAEQVINIPLTIAAVEGGSFNLSLTEFDIPGDWTAELHDLFTGTKYNLDTFDGLEIQAMESNLGDPERRFMVNLTSPLASSVMPPGELPAVVSLSQNYPNPFNPTTQIAFELPETTDVVLEVYNIQGQRVAVLLSGQQQAGKHSVTFDAAHLSSGVYIYRLMAGGQTLTKKMTLVK